MSLLDDFNAAVAPTPPERREAARKPVHLPAALFMAGSRLQARTLDLTRSGACVRCVTAVPVGSQLSLVLPSATSAGGFLRLRAKVAYCVLSGREGFRLGLQFMEVDASSAEALEELLNRRASP
jgi:hypothetical protein